MYQVRIVPACPSARLAAWLIDTGITLALLVGTVYWTSHQLSIERFLLTADYRQLAIVLLVPTAIQLMILSVTGKTIGMFSMDLQILQADGESATLSNMLRRPLGLIAIAVTGGLIALLPFLNEHRKTIGDLLSGTRVVESMVSPTYSALASTSTTGSRSTRRNTMPVSTGAGFSVRNTFSPEWSPTPVALMVFFRVRCLIMMSLFRHGNGLNWKP